MGKTKYFRWERWVTSTRWIPVFYSERPHKVVSGAPRVSLEHEVPEHMTFDDAIELFPAPIDEESKGERIQIPGRESSTDS